MPDSGKKLCELRVCDLKEELEKRNLETVGAKATLVERLEQAIKSEGLDPSKYFFVPNSKAVGKKIMDSKKIDRKAVEEIKIKEEPIDDEEIALNAEDVGEEEDYDDNEQYENDEGDEDDEVDQVGDVDDECVIIEEEGRTEVDKGNGSNDGPEGEEENAGESNEESINLTIGEDEQKLLHDEAPDEKEKCTDAEGDTTGRNSAQKSTKTVAALKDTRTSKGGSSSSKDERKCSKSDDDKSKRKDEKSGDKKDKDNSEQKSSSNKTSQKDDKEKSTLNTSTKSSSTGKQTTPSRNLWVSGLSSLTRASDLKTIFSKYGKVIGAKVVTNTRTPGTRCYGYVTMSSSSDASRCIEHLHHTELHGRIISVERTKNEIGSSSTSVAKSRVDTTKKDDDRKIRDTTSKTRDDKRKTIDTKKDDASKKPEVEKDKQRDKEKEKDHNKKDEKEKEKEKDKDKEKSVASNHEKRAISKDGQKDRNTRQHSNRSRSNDRNRNDRNIRDQRQRDREREQRLRQREYIQLREERERQRLRERERELREEERRRREIRDRQRQEEARLAEERRKLAQERERLEKEKAELLRLERERQKLEREKIELERLELKRQQMKIMHAREDPIKRLGKRSSDERYTEVSNRKRSSGSDSRFEAPPPPRFDASLVTSSRSYDKKRDDYNSSASSKRAIDDFPSSTKRMDYSKRDDFSSAVTKRAALDDYPVVPPKRSTDDYGKRNNDYLSSTSSKRIIDDYGASKSSRDDYKREVEIRHVPTAGNNSGSSFHTSRDVSSTIHKANAGRYVDSERSTSGYRRTGIDDIRSSASGNKRYENSNTYGTTNNGGSVWASSTHLGGSSGGGGGVKSYVGNGMSNMHSNSTWQKSVEENNWRPMQSAQDRFDRTYNERSNSGYTAGGMFGSAGRYGGQMRY
ncbi:SAFB-like transcription modulator isoform X1 [Bactrocera dorsalis]|uniref:SAFB-like transcription modulator isoform X1 n=2 Tax=Bactrocera dorsalis TaxID=27457 RepID=A0A6I9VEM1_BACDO|nr:SAFB-like transcription modulator isoform X1 [Bactrocera dorsalis]